MFNFFKFKSFKSHSPSDGHISETQSGTNSKTPTYKGFNQNLKDKIEYAFTSGGVDYFMFTAELNMPFTRFMNALDIYDELEQGLNPGVLLKYIQTVNSICIDPKVKTIDQMKQKVGIATYMIEERVNIHVSLTQHIKLATVRYFDENEDVTSYDHGYNVKKIKHWTENHDVDDFFFMQPIRNFFPQLNDFQANLGKYLEGESLQMLKTMESLFILDTSENSDPELQSYLSLQKEALEIMKNWANSRSTSIV